MEIVKITLASEYWNEEDIDEIREIFHQDIERRKVERWAQESLDPALVIIFAWIGKEIVSGILNKIGEDTWNRLKEKIVGKVSDKKYPGLTLSFKNGNGIIEFDLRSRDSKIIEKGFDTIKKALETINNPNEKIYFNFDIATQNWKKIEERKFVKIVTGVCAGSGVPIVKDGKTFVLRDEDLPLIAKMNEGLPLTLGHEGKIIGKITKTWVEGNFVKFEAGIFEGLSKEEMDELDEIKGVSMGFTRPEDE
ncbi:MAG: hypothetical protein ACREBI_10455 [Nitrosotalea sp.]